MVKAGFVGEAGLDQRGFCEALNIISHPDGDVQIREA